MLIAKIDGDNISVADYQSLYPNTSFPADGPTDAWLQENGCMKVNVWLPHDRDTEKLVPAAPYIQGDWVCTVQVEPLSQDEIDQRQASAKAQVKAAAEQRLKETDWTQMPDVDLVNKSDFTAYRAAVRAIVLNPPVEVSEWPVKPEEVWNAPDPQLA